MQPPALLVGTILNQQHQLSSQAEKSHQPILLNLDLECPPQSNNFELILEVVSNHEEDKAAARNRWIAYKQAGYEVQGRQW